MDITLPPGRVAGALTPPCSKSYAQRALAASLLSEETSMLHNVEFCDDTRSALRCIEALGAGVERIDEHTLSVRGGLRPRGGVLRLPAEDGREDKEADTTGKEKYFPVKHLQQFQRSILPQEAACR